MATLAINILSLAFPILMLQIYDRILVNHSSGTLNVLVFGVAVAVLMEGSLRLARSYITSWAGISYEYAIASNAMRYFIDADLVHVEKHGAGERLQSIASFAKLREFYGGQALVTLIDVPFAFLFLGLIAYLAGWLAVVPFLLICVFGIIGWKTGKKLKNSIAARDASDNKRYDFIVEVLHGIHTVKSMGTEASFHRRYEKLEEKSSIDTYNSAVLSATSNNYGALFNEIMVISVLSVGAPMVINGHFTTGTLAASVLLAGRLMQPIQKTLSLWSRFQDFVLAEEKTKKIFATPQVKREEKIKHKVREGHLEIENVVFAYSGSAPILNNIKMELELGDTISISGDYNSGKSTLLRLMAGIYVPISGSVKIDNVEASSYIAEELVDHVGFMSDEGVIFQGTIMDNLTAFHPEYEKKAIEIAALLRIDKEVNKLPKGYETMLIDSQADPITRGLKQRIIVARVLVRKPRVLLFDNADRSLDRDGYNYVIRLLHLLKGKTTMVLVSSDQNIMRLADKEFILENGSLKDASRQDSKIYALRPFQELRL